MSLRELRRQFPLRERRPLLVTEVTRMSQAVCVACYDLHAGSIVRPLPRNITNWPNVEYTSGRITVGTVLGVVPADPQPVSDYPHASEDVNIPVKRIARRRDRRSPFQDWRDRDGGRQVAARRGTHYLWRAA